MSENEFNPLQQRLADLREQKESIERQLRETYAESVREDDPELKVCDDGTATFLSVDPPIRGFRFPFEVHGIAWSNTPVLEEWKPSGRAQAPWVKVRPCAEEFGDKTYLGIMIGDLALGSAITRSADGVLKVGPGHGNPMIYLPDQRRVVMGCASWWGYVDSPDDLKEINDSDIDSVWYVRALRELGGEEGSSDV